MKAFLDHYLKKMVPAPFFLNDGTEVRKVGEGEAAFTLTVHKMPEKDALLASTSLALGEAYMRGDIEVDQDLYQVLDLLLSRIDRFTRDPKILKKLLFTSRSHKNQEKEVQFHYDIGNSFYRLWLDETMNYSCAYFKEDTDSLYTAQVQKTDHILQKLHLEEGMRLLDIGCGWGFLLIQAAKKYRVKAMGVTLSKEQYASCRQRIEQEGLSELVTVRLMDYRELKGSGLQFDRIVSVGMLEHVGRGSYGEFMENVDAVLVKGGLVLLHFISALSEHPGDAWIKKYIFPGGVIPSFREIVQLLPEHSFYTLDVESLRRHYTKTLLCWRSKLIEHQEEIREDKGIEFVRMWELYLTSCAAAFHNGVVDLHQILLSKNCNNELPMTRIV